MHRLRYAILTVTLMLAQAACGSSARALEILVTVDTSSIAATTAGSLDFQFSAGRSTAQTATATITNFASTSLTMGGITLTNSVSGGPLPAELTILNNPSVLNNRARQAVTYGAGSSMSFTLNLTGNALTNEGTADSTFYFSLLNSSNQSIFGAYGLAHLTITIPATGPRVPTISSIPLITATVVPEPGSIVLAMSATTALILARRRMKST